MSRVPLCPPTAPLSCSGRCCFLRSSLPGRAGTWLYHHGSHSESGTAPGSSVLPRGWGYRRLWESYRGARTGPGRLRKCRTQPSSPVTEDASSDIHLKAGETQILRKIASWEALSADPPRRQGPWLGPHSALTAHRAGGTGKQPLPHAQLSLQGRGQGRAGCASHLSFAHFSWLPRLGWEAPLLAGSNLG